jgi:hypothetical protein
MAAMIQSSTWIHAVGDISLAFSAMIDSGWEMLIETAAVFWPLVAIGQFVEPLL